MSRRLPLSLLLLTALLWGGAGAAERKQKEAPDRRIDEAPEDLDAPLLPVPGLLRGQRPGPKTDEQPALEGGGDAACGVPMLPQRPASLPFGPGERLDFDVRFFGFKTGGVSLHMSGRELIDGKATYPVRAVGRTEGAATLLGGVDVRMMTWLDPVTMTPVRMASRARQDPLIGRTLLVREDAAFQRAGQIDSSLKWWRDGKAFRSDAHKAANGDLVDVLALLYYGRSRVLAEGSPFCFTVFHRRGLWRVEGTIGKAELVSSPWGSREALRIEAGIRRLSRTGVGKDVTEVTVWVTDDDARLPLKIEKPERFGTIEAVLARYAPGRKLVRRRGPT